MAKGSYARRKGHTFERDRVKKWKAVGFDKAMTSRYGSRYEDDVNNNDIIGIHPFREQCKSVQSLGVLHNVLASMKEEKGNYNLVSHKVLGKGVIVAMWEEDFMELIQMLKINNVL
jgi:hypothetical protein